jgi:hypothetical protein
LASLDSASCWSSRTTSMRGTTSSSRCSARDRAGSSFCVDPRPGRTAGRRRRSIWRAPPRDVLLDAVAGALSIPAATDTPFIGFSPESYWRGRDAPAHRSAGQPAASAGGDAQAGARQVIIVAAAAEQGRPHGLATRRVHPRARLGEYLASEEAAAIRDALPIAEGWFDAIFVVRPGHNRPPRWTPAGAFDAQSDRWQSVGELVDRGYEDAYRQFVDPIVGASGDEMARNATLTSGE